jgi:hypothetical protein
MHVASSRPTRLLESEAELQRDLDVVDTAVGEVAADGDDLEPADVADSLGGRGDRVRIAMSMQSSELRVTSIDL